MNIEKSTNSLESTPKRLTPAIVRCEDAPLPPHGLTESFRTLPKAQYADHNKIFDRECKAYAQLRELNAAMHERGKVIDEDGKHYVRGFTRYQDNELEQFQRAQAELRAVEAAYRALDERCAREASEEAPKASAQEDPPTPLSTLPVPVNTALTPVKQSRKLYRFPCRRNSCRWKFSRTS